MSQSKVFEEKSIRSLRAFMDARFSRFLRANYHNPEHVAVCFAVRYQTALNWWNGDNGPSAFAVSLAYDYHPESARRHLSVREDGE